ncbi:MAG: cysteine--tRNA ligase [Candidatus Omnitrophica bacterium]|nr:cysteine--tRNA ligase [Candidatus Omnitrophota bacterium]
MKIYNSLSRKKEIFKPLKQGQVKMYVCGPTVYDDAHLGHARSAYIFEVVRTYLEYRGYRVKFVKNITDVDDKIIARAKQELPGEQINQAVKKIAEKYTKSYYTDMDALGIRRATVAPFATKHINPMQEYILKLIQKGFAYESVGSVYFEVRRFQDYGQLSGQNLEEMVTHARIEKDEKKKDALDFALWKKAKENEPFWESPWGGGRPGWHIECSVMASIYLGEVFDIHAGGQDLIFPHHENEIAQACCYSGKGFAKIWMHNGLLTINGQKMAKSLGNFVSIQDFLKGNIADVLKLFFLSGHYSSPLDFNQDRIAEAKKVYQRFQIFYDKLNKKSAKRRAARQVKLPADILKFKKRFQEAMDDDFNTPQVLAAMFDLINYCNKLLVDYQEKKLSALRAAQDILTDFSQIFGINFAQVAKKAASKTKIEKLIKTRQDLRKKGDFVQADQIRKDLEVQGIILEDSKEGTTWRRKI